MVDAVSQDLVHAVRVRTGVPGVAVGLWDRGRVQAWADGVLVLGEEEPVTVATPFRAASITKSFVAALAASTLDLDAPALDGATARQLLSHRAGFCCESLQPLPPAVQGLFSYSNAGYWAVGRACSEACGISFEEALRARVLAPLGLAATVFEEPDGVARGHVQEGQRGHRPVLVDAYPAWRRASGGLWSTVGDLLRFGAHLLGGDGPLAPEARAALVEPQVEVLGASYGLGLWLRGAGGAPAIEHEGSTGGYQSLLLLLPESRRALAVLTNSWRGSTFVRRLLLELGLGWESPAAPPGVELAPLAGRYGLEGAEAVVTPTSEGLRVELAEVGPTTGARLAVPPAVARALGGGVFGLAGGVLGGHRLDFPRPGVGRFGWVAMPRVDA